MRLKSDFHWFRSQICLIICGQKIWNPVTVRQEEGSRERKVRVSLLHCLCKDTVNVSFRYCPKIMRTFCLLNSWNYIVSIYFGPKLNTIQKTLKKLPKIIKLYANIEYDLFVSYISTQAFICKEINFCVISQNKSLFY